MATTIAALEPLDRSWAVLLTTYKRDGTGVDTPVNLAVEGDRAYFRTYAKAWKSKRLAHTPQVALAPASVRGRVKGSTIAGTARLLRGAEEAQARRLLARRHPVFQRFVIPWAHRISRYTTLHYEVVVTQ